MKLEHGIDAVVVKKLDPTDDFEALGKDEGKVSPFTSDT